MIPLVNSGGVFYAQKSRYQAKKIRVKLVTIEEQLHKKIAAQYIDSNPNILNITLSA